MRGTVGAAFDARRHGRAPPSAVHLVLARGAAGGRPARAASLGRRRAARPGGTGGRRPLGSGNTSPRIAHTLNPYPLSATTVSYDHSA